MTSNDLKSATRQGASPLSFDLHPLYAGILRDGATVRAGEVLGLDGDLQRVLVAPFAGVVRLLITGQGEDRRVKVYLRDKAVTPGRSEPLTLRDTANYLETSRN